MSALEHNVENGGAVWINNPAAIQLLGLSPILAVSSNLVSGVGLGLATLLVCILSCSSASLAKDYIPERWRLAWYMLIIAGYTTIAATVYELYFYPLFLELDIYLPLICCNAAILVRMEIHATRSSVSSATKDATKTGLGFLATLLVFSACRELLVSGTLFSNWQILFPAYSELAITTGKFKSGFYFRFANTQAGAFILLGLLVALYNVVSRTHWRDHDVETKSVKPAKRARVTGRLNRE